MPDRSKPPATNSAATAALSVLYDNLLVSVGEVKAELVRVRDGLHGLRSDVNVSLGKAELSRVEQDGRQQLLAKDLEAMRINSASMGTEKSYEHRELWDAIKAINAQIEVLMQYKASIKGGMITLGLAAPVASAILTRILAFYWH